MHGRLTFIGELDGTQKMDVGASGIGQKILSNYCLISELTELQSPL